MFERIMQSICVKYIKLQKERCNNYIEQLSNIDSTNSIDCDIAKAKKDYELLCKTENSIAKTVYYKDGSKCVINFGD